MQTCYVLQTGVRAQRRFSGMNVRHTQNKCTFAPVFNWKKMLAGVFIILFFYALGEGVAWLIQGFVPGSVVGMILLFTALCLKIVKPERIKPVVKFLCDNMALFFVPAGVGIVNATDMLSRHWQAIVMACAVSTVLVIVVVAAIQQWFEKRRR